MDGVFNPSLSPTNIVMLQKGPMEIGSSQLSRLVSVNEALRILGMGRTNFYARLNACEIKAIKVGRRTFIAEAELQNFIAKLPHYTPPLP